MALSELPPLPQLFALGKTRINGEEHGHYSAKQMQDYARAALAQAQPTLAAVAPAKGGIKTWQERCGPEIAGRLSSMLRLKIAAEIADLRAAVVQQQDDALVAARYRWLVGRARVEGRDGGMSSFYRFPYIPKSSCSTFSSAKPFNHNTVNAAIDAAIAALTGSAK